MTDRTISFQHYCDLDCGYQFTMPLSELRNFMAICGGTAANSVRLVYENDEEVRAELRRLGDLDYLTMPEDVPAWFDTYATKLAD